MLDLYDFQQLTGPAGYGRWASYKIAVEEYPSTPWTIRQSAVRKTRFFVCKYQHVVAVTNDEDLANRIATGLALHDL